jgi:hypothetical protein
LARPRIPSSRYKAAAGHAHAVVAAKWAAASSRLRDRPRPPPFAGIVIAIYREEISSSIAPDGAHRVIAPHPRLKIHLSEKLTIRSPPTRTHCLRIDPEPMNHSTHRRRASSSTACSGPHYRHIGISGFNPNICSVKMKSSVNQ